MTPTPTPPLNSNPECGPRQDVTASPPPPDMDITYIEQNELQLLRCKTVIHYNKGSHKVSTNIYILIG